MNNESGLDYDSSFGWMSHRVRHRSSASWELFGGLISVSWLGVVLLALAVIFSLSGCSTVQTAIEQSEVAEEAVEQGEDLIRAGEDFADQAGETGKAAKRLAPNRTCIEAKDASRKFNVQARMVGADKTYWLKPTEFVRWTPSAGWLSDKHVFTIEMDIYRGRQFVKTTAQTVENEFNKYEISKKGCGILYFTSDGDEIQGLRKPREMNF